jgi:hypothetical protein
MQGGASNFLPRSSRYGAMASGGPAGSGHSAGRLCRARSVVVEQKLLQPRVVKTQRKGEAPSPTPRRGGAAAPPPARTELDPAAAAVASTPAAPPAQAAAAKTTRLEHGALHPCRRLVRPLRLAAVRLLRPPRPRSVPRDRRASRRRCAESSSRGAESSPPPALTSSLEQ